MTPANSLATFKKGEQNVILFPYVGVYAAELTRLY